MCASVYSLPFGWLVFFSLALHWLRARCGWGDRVVHGQGSWLNFSKVLNFSAASISHFHFSTNHLAAIILHSCLTTACHHAISSPPRPPSTERPIGISVSLPYPSQTLSLEQTDLHTICWRYNSRFLACHLEIFPFYILCSALSISNFRLLSLSHILLFHCLHLHFSKTLRFE